jgi:predicted acylesterase/phospholipase RssA
MDNIYKLIDNSNNIININKVIDNNIDNSNIKKKINDQNKYIENINNYSISESDKIQHLVISGGGPVGFSIYGAAKYLSKVGIWDISNIKTIYGTSIGAYMGVVFSLKYDWETLDEYFIKRPWEKLINITPENIFDIWNSKGFLGQEFMIEAIRPLLEAKDLSIDITLEELYYYNKIELHMFSVDINSFPLENTDISYKTHSKMKLVDALYMTAAAPFMFKPFIIGNSCFVDGGIINNYPIDICLKQTSCNPSEILSFRCILSINNELKDSKPKKIDDESNLYQYLEYLMRLFIKYINNDNKQSIIMNTVNCVLNDVNNYSDWINILSEKVAREKYIKIGENYGYIFYKFKTC